MIPRFRCAEPSCAPKMVTGLLKSLWLVLGFVGVNAELPLTAPLDSLTATEKTGQIPFNKYLRDKQKQAYDPWNTPETLDWAQTSNMPLPDDIQQQLKRCQLTCKDVLFGSGVTSSDGRNDLLRKKAYVQCLCLFTFRHSQASNTPVPLSLMAHQNKETFDALKSMAIVNITKEIVDINKEFKELLQEVQEQSAFRMSE